MSKQNGLDAHSKEYLQSLFEKMADTHPGEVRLERWHRDASATIAIEDPDGGGKIRRRIRWSWNQGGIPLVCVSRPKGTQGTDFVHVSPRASAVLAVMLYC